ncbi:MAG: hypothetical protein QME81_13335 [bacterium]|nr:hypothetical protein [bacterium]
MCLRRKKLDIHWSRSSSWTAEEINLLGTMPDRQVAQIIGRSETAVNSCRLRRQIPGWGTTDKQWTKREEKLLGTKPDRVAAQLLGVPTKIVEDRRRMLNIPAYRGKAGK